MLWVGGGGKWRSPPCSGWVVCADQFVDAFGCQPGHSEGFGSGCLDAESALVNLCFVKFASWIS